MTKSSISAVNHAKSDRLLVGEGSLVLHAYKGKFSPIIEHLTAELVPISPEPDFAEGIPRGCSL